MVEIHPRIHLRHPEIDDEDVLFAWTHPLAMRHRNFDPPAYIAAAGADTKGRIIELVGVELEDGGFLIYHAQKLTKKMAHELELEA